MLLSNQPAIVRWVRTRHVLLWSLPVVIFLTSPIINDAGQDKAPCEILGRLRPSSYCISPPANPARHSLHSLRCKLASFQYWHDLWRYCDAQTTHLPLRFKSGFCMGPCGLICNPKALLQCWFLHLILFLAFLAYPTMSCLEIPQAKVWLFLYFPFFYNIVSWIWQRQGGLWRHFSSEIPRMLCFAITGTSLALFWFNLALTPTNGFPLQVHHVCIDLPVDVSQDTMVGRVFILPSVICQDQCSKSQSPHPLVCVHWFS